MMMWTQLSLLAVCLGLSQAFFWSKHQCPDTSLEGKLVALASALDGENRNGVIGEAADVVAVFDMDKDGCVDMWEWTWTLQTSYGIGTPLASSSYFLVASCPRTASSSVPLTYEAFVERSLRQFIPACSGPSGSMFGRRYRRHASGGGWGSFFKSLFGKIFGNYKPSTLFDTDCDCKAARVLCQSDATWSASDVCKGESVCTGKGTLAQRVKANLDNNDRDGDGFATAAEIYIDVSENYDTDGDDCVTQGDFIRVAMQLYNISEAMAAGRFPPVPAGSCLFKPSDFLPTGQRATFVLTSDEFVDDNVGALVTVCEGLSPAEFKANCDCAQLDDSCRNDAFLGSVHSCQSYLACQGKGTLAQRVQANLDNNDRDGDGFVTAAEIYIDVSREYDQDGDDCVTQGDFARVFQELYGFSEAYGAGRFPPIPAGECLFKPTEFLPSGARADFVLGVEEFLDANIGALITICEGLTTEEFASNCDCAQLTKTCQDEPLTKDLVSCGAYLQRV